MSRWKIFYTDGTSIKEDNPNILGDPSQIARPKRCGVHSVIQEMDDGVTREVIEQYHYIYLSSEGKWLGIGLDGLLDRLISSLDNIACVLHGRTMTSDGFLGLKRTVREDTDVVGAISAAHNAAHSLMWEHRGENYRPQRFPGTEVDIKAPWVHTCGNDKRTGQPYEDWTTMTRHRQYDPLFSEPGPYGEYREH
jgi:hypothetical protein